MNKVKYPYNVNSATQELALEALAQVATVNEWIQLIVSQREELRAALQALPFTVTVYSSDANFLLVKMEGATRVYRYLANRGIIVRDRSSVILCDDCLRITVGTPEENKQLINALKEYK
jgi:histidinol-phosphate aminotransferase